MVDISTYASYYIFFSDSQTYWPISVSVAEIPY